MKFSGPENPALAVIASALLAGTGLPVASTFAMVVIRLAAARALSVGAIAPAASALSRVSAIGCILPSPAVDAGAASMRIIIRRGAAVSASAMVSNTPPTGTPAAPTDRIFSAASSTAQLSWVSQIAFSPGSVVPKSITSRIFVGSVLGFSFTGSLASLIATTPMSQIHSAGFRIPPITPIVPPPG